MFDRPVVFRRVSVSVTFLAYSLPQCAPLRCHAGSRPQAQMSSTVHQITRAAAIAAMLTLASQALAQSDDADAEMRVQQLENQLRQLTGQNEELQYRNRQLEERLRALQGGAPATPGAQPSMAQPGMVQPGIAQPNIAAAPPMQPGPAYRQPADRAAADCRSSADHAGVAQGAAGAWPASWRCFRPQPESECSRCAARARRRPASDSGRGAGRRSRRPRGRRAARSRQHRH